LRPTGHWFARPSQPISKLVPAFFFDGQIFAPRQQVLVHPGDKGQDGRSIHSSQPLAPFGCYKTVADEVRRGYVGKGNIGQQVDDLTLFQSAYYVGCRNLVSWEAHIR
jgi:hypothetical protein